MALVARHCTHCGTSLSPPGARCAECGAEPARLETARWVVTRDWVAAGALGVGLAVALGLVLHSVSKPSPGTTLSDRTLIQWFAEMAGVLLAAGAVGSAILFPRRRWREALLGALVVGALAAGITFDVWSNAVSGPPDCTAARPCDDSNALASWIFAVPAALLVMTGSGAGRVFRR